MTVFDLLEEREATPDSIGPTLRRAREAVGYSVSDVAERMRLNRHQIENLEAERFELFPVSVFLRGYLTSYARLVGIDAEPLLDAYDRRGFGPPQLHSKEDTERTTGRGSELTVTITTVVVIAVLIVLSALWWRDQWTGGDGGPPGVAVAPPDEGGAPGGAEASLPAVGPGSEEETPARGDAAEAADPEPPPVAAGEEPPPVVPADGRAPEAAAGAEAVPATGADAGAPAEGGPRRGEGAEGPAEPAAPASPETIPGEGAEPAPDPPESAQESAQARASGSGAEAAGSFPGGEGGLASLVIRVREDCWLMIRDAGERLIYRDLAAAGTVLELAAEPPIGIVAGYASGIEIEYDGEPFDLSPYVEQDTGTARFRLGS